MLDGAELEELAAALESDRVERKRSLADSTAVRQAICAFANDYPDYRLPGVVFVGLEDDGSCADLEITDALLRELAGMRDDGSISPIPSMVVQRHVLNGCEVAVVVVEPASAPPVRLRGRTMIRVGPRRAVATAEEERRLSEKRRANDLPFDARPLSTASLDDLDFGIFSGTYLPAAIDPSVLADDDRTIPEQLVSLRFADESGLPTAVGILTLGKDPRALIPGAYVQFARFDGVDLASPVIDQEELSGPLPQLLADVDRVIRANIRTALSFRDSDQAYMTPDYPLEALLQVARNAVMHRTYDASNAPVRIYWFNDRIEVHSPGGLFGQVNDSNFGTGITDYRNPSIASAMKDLGYVQRFGAGLQIAKRVLEENGNPPLEWELSEVAVAMIVRSRS